jgi:hypothetical protein
VVGTAPAARRIPDARILEIVVHGLDMTDALRLAPVASEEGVAVTVAILEGLLGESPTPELAGAMSTSSSKGPVANQCVAKRARALGSNCKALPAARLKNDGPATTEAQSSLIVSPMDESHEDVLRRILIANDDFMDPLRCVRTVDPPDWVVGSGLIRNTVWDHLHGFAIATPAADVDVAFFDPSDVSRERDARYEDELARLRPEVNWDVTNQAGVHLWYERKFGYPSPPARSVEDALGMWPETATAVAVRLLPNDELYVVAPCGLQDLLGLVHRRNPRQVTRESFEERLRQKRINERWPRVKIVRD